MTNETKKPAKKAASSKKPAHKKSHEGKIPDGVRTSEPHLPAKGSKKFHNEAGKPYPKSVGSDGVENSWL